MSLGKEDGEVILVVEDNPASQMLVEAVLKGGIWTPPDIDLSGLTIARYSAPAA